MYGLTFKGLNYALNCELVSYEAIKNIAKKNNIDVPEISEEQLDMMLKHMKVREKFDPLAPFFKLFYVALGRQKMRDVIRVAFDKLPEQLFGNHNVESYFCVGSYKLNPLDEDNKHIVNLVGSAIAVLGYAGLNRIISASEQVELVGEDADMILTIMTNNLRKLPNEALILKALNPNNISKYADRLNRIS